MKMRYLTFMKEDQTYILYYFSKFSQKIREVFEICFKEAEEATGKQINPDRKHVMMQIPPV